MFRRSPRRHGHGPGHTRTLRAPASRAFPAQELQPRLDGTASRRFFLSANRLALRAHTEARGRVRRATHRFTAHARTSRSTSACRLVDHRAETGRSRAPAARTTGGRSRQDTRRRTRPHTRALRVIPSFQDERVVGTGLDVHEQAVDRPRRQTPVASSPRSSACTKVVPDLTNGSSTC